MYRNLLCQFLIVWARNLVFSFASCSCKIFCSLRISESRREIPSGGALVYSFSTTEFASFWTLNNQLSVRKLSLRRIIMLSRKGSRKSRRANPILNLKIFLEVRNQRSSLNHATSFAHSRSQSGSLIDKRYVPFRDIFTYTLGPFNLLSLFCFKQDWIDGKYGQLLSNQLDSKVCDCDIWEAKGNAQFFLLQNRCERI